MDQQTAQSKRRTAPATSTPTSTPLFHSPNPLSISLSNSPSISSSESTSPSLSSSEPTLKFPRPQGSSHLANWISNSDPDIMRVTTVSAAPDEAGVGLSDSTYELISTDADSPVCDLGSDCSHADDDDDQSLPGTEHTCEDVDDVDQPSELEPEPELETEHMVEPESEDDLQLVNDPTRKEEEEEEEENKHTRGSHSVISLASTDYPGDDMLRARKSSIEYTEQSLELPSLMAPAGKKAVVWERVWDRLREAISTPIPYEPYIAVFLAVTLGLAMFSASWNATSPVSNTAPGLPATKVDSTISMMTAINITAPTTSHLATAKPSAAQNSAVIPFVGLVLEKPSSSKNTCSAELTNHREVLLRIPASTKTSWLAQGSIAISVYRGQPEADIKSNFFSTNEGILIEIPWWDRHGIVSVSVLTSRRPKINETYEIDFGHAVTAVLGAAQEFGERLADMTASTLGDVVSTSHQLAQGAVLSFGNSTSAILHNTRSLSTSLSSSISRQLNDIQDSVLLQMRTARVVGADLGHEAAITLLRAQIASRLWYLRLANKHDEHNDYQRKAVDFMTLQRENINRERRERPLMTESKSVTSSKCRGLTRWVQRCSATA